MATTPEELKGKYILLSKRSVEEKDGRYSAFCDELGIGTCAETKDAAIKRVEAAALLILNKATESGDILGLLEDRGIRLYPVEQEKPTFIVKHYGEARIMAKPAWSPVFGNFSFGAAVNHSGYAALDPDMLIGVK